MLQPEGSFSCTFRVGTGQPGGLEQLLYLSPHHINTLLLITLMLSPLLHGSTYNTTQRTSTHQTITHQTTAHPNKGSLLGGEYAPIFLFY